MMRRACLLIGILSSNYCLSDISNVSVSGFGSVVGAYVADGSGYIADYPNLGMYDDYLDFGEESRLGLQVNANVHERLKGTVQLISRAANEYEVEADWLYLTYELSDNANLQAGRMRLPVYKFSEYMDVGLAYDWLRIPSDTYSLDVVQYNGLRMNYLTGTDDLPLRLSLFAGSEENDHSELMSYLFFKDVGREFTNIVGAVFDITYSVMNIRLSYTDANMVETDNGTVAPEIDVSFADGAITLLLGPVEFMVEYNEYEPYYKSYFGSISYKIDDFTPYMMWSQFDLDLPFEKHDTSSIGVRYNIESNIALKFDVSTINDEGVFPVAGVNTPNPVYHAAKNGDGDASVVSVGVDFVF